MYYSCCYDVYYEDTDCLGVVYHANYLKFAERARSMWLRHHLHPDALNWLQQKGWGIVVSEISAKYRRAERLNDTLIVDFLPQNVSYGRLVVRQNLAVLAQIPDRQAETIQHNACCSMRVILALVDLAQQRPLAWNRCFPDLTLELQNFTTQQHQDLAQRTL